MTFERWCSIWHKVFFGLIAAVVVICVVAQVTRKNDCINDEVFNCGSYVGDCGDYYQKCDYPMWGMVVPVLLFAAWALPYMFFVSGYRAEKGAPPMHLHMANVDNSIQSAQNQSNMDWNNWQSPDAPNNANNR